MSKPSALHQQQNASQAAQYWINNGEAHMHISETVERVREEQRRAALAATAPPLSFADHMYKTEEPN
jgi:hypothetical protein